MKRLHIRLERDTDEKVWYATAVEDERIHTFGRSVASALDNARDAVALWYEIEPEEVDLVPQPPLRDEVTDQLYRAAVGYRDDLHVAQQNVAQSTLVVTHRLNREGYSLRDIAALMGISHQRVQQLLAQPDTQAS